MCVLGKYVRNEVYGRYRFLSHLLFLLFICYDYYYYCCCFIIVIHHHFVHYNPEEHI